MPNSDLMLADLCLLCRTEQPGKLEIAAEGSMAARTTPLELSMADSAVPGLARVVRQHSMAIESTSSNSLPGSVIDANIVTKSPSHR